MDHEIVFRVICFPRCEIHSFEFYAKSVEKYLTDHCRFQISSLRKFTLVGRSTPSTHASVLETLLASFEVSGILTEAEPTCQKFISLWLQNYLHAFTPEGSPWLVINDKRAFENSRIIMHVLQNQKVHIGTMVSSSDFVFHGNFFAEVKFLHDTRNLKFKYELFVEKYLILSYESIKHIITNGLDVLIIFSNPPIARDEEKMWRLNFNLIDRDVLGRSNAILLKSVPESIKDELLPRLHFRCFELSISFFQFTCRAYVEPGIMQNFQDSLEFSCGYLIEALIRRTFSLELQGVNEFLNTADTLYKEDPRILRMALSDLVLVAELGYPIHLKTSLLLLFQTLKQKSSIESLTNILPNHTTFVRRAVLTPARLLLFPEELIMGNRFLRNFNPDFALKVSFRDDDFAKLNMRFPFEEFISQVTLFKPMFSGLFIAGRKYELIGWSDSEIKDHCVWMYATDDKEQTASQIRQWMGYYIISDLAELMVRKAQCISETFYTISMGTENIAVEDDIERNLNAQTGKPYCFSNGIGRISEHTVKMVSDSLKITKTPSAFQIRYGGVKGMVALDPNLKDKSLVFRRSMMKFESRNLELEIVRYSTPAKVFLNRSMIQILENRGVSMRVLLGIQEKAFETLTEMLLDSQKASYYLQQDNKIIDVDFIEAYKCGIDLSSEPFFRAMLLALHEHELVGVREDARLPIDPSEGRTMFGVMDETATLKYGQVFVQYSKDLLQSCDEKIILTGRVMVAKNPCYLAGDVRIFTCVDVPGLHHIVDCIVFPQLGSRPHISEMSGSDEYGSEYSVIWKKQLLFKQNAEPQNCPLTRGRELQRPITLQDTVFLLIEYIQNDRFEHIANTHLAVSDEQGVESALTIQQAHYCRIETDFPMTEQIANLEKVLKPDRYPDFMEKCYERTYKSRKALGKLFRICDGFCTSIADIRFQYSKVNVDEDLVYPGWEEYREQALYALDSYSRHLEHFLRVFGLNHEVQIMTGVVSIIHPYLKRSKNRYDETDVVNVCIRALWKWYRDEFWAELQENELSPTDLLKKVSAYYMVTYSTSNPSVLSFPWIFAHYLSQLKQLRFSERHRPTLPVMCPILTQLNLEIEKTEFPLPSILTSGNYEKHTVFYENNIKTLLIATKALLHWCREVCVVNRPGVRMPKQGFMTENEVSQLIMHFATRQSTDDGAVPFIYKFFRYCMSFRFLDYDERNRLLPFPLPQSVFLSKQAMVAYRNLALTGDLSAMNIGERSRRPDELVLEMEPIKIPNQSAKSQETLHQFLLKNSSVQDISIRLEGKKFYIINAEGNVSSIKALKALLRDQ